MKIPVWLNFLVILTLVASSLFVNATVTEDEASLRPHIYEISQPGNPNVSYVLGSYHYGVGSSDLPFWVQRLHNNADVNFYEIEVGSREDYKLLQDFRLDPASAAEQWGIKNSSETISQLRAAGVSEEIATYLPIGECGTTAYLLNFALSRPWQSLDTELQLRSVQNGKKIFYLDTKEIRQEAAALIAEDKSKPCFIEEYLKNPMIAQYFFTKVEEGLWEGIKEFKAGDRPVGNNEVERADIAYRNKTWADKLIPILAAKNSFIVVGLYHLYGKTSLIDLLRERGFQIRRLVEDPKPSDRFIRFSR